jgi:type II secretory pathway pseudopilin PulG
MVALLVGLAVMAVVMSAAMPVWRTMAKREAEEELVFRGQQYARAIGLYQRKFANAYPPNLDLLLKQKFLRKKYRDPMTKDGEFQLLYQGAMMPGAGVPGAARPGMQTGRGDQTQQQGSASQATGQPSGMAQTDARQSAFGSVGGQPGVPAGGIIGVASKSKEKSLRVYNGRTTYNEWQFVWNPQTATPGMMPGGNRPGPMRPPFGFPGSAQSPRGTGSGGPSSILPR